MRRRDRGVFGLVGVVVGGLLTGVIDDDGRTTPRAAGRADRRRIVREHLLDVMRAGEDAVEDRPADLPTAVGRLLTV